MQPVSVAARAPTTASAGCRGSGRRPTNQRTLAGLGISASTVGNPGSVARRRRGSVLEVLVEVLEFKGAQALVGRRAAGLCPGSPSIVSRCK